MTDVSFERLCSIAGKEAVRREEPMRKHTSFRIGGPADCFITVKDPAVLTELVAFCRQEGLPYFILGRGTNLLVKDEGFRGVILYTGEMNGFSFDGTVLTAAAGALLSELALSSAKRGLGGLEFAAGIPGTLGGGITMNAGAYDGEMKDVVLSAEVYFPEEGTRTLPVEELALGYRTSIIKNGGPVVLSARLQLREKEPELIKERIQELARARAEKQPLEYPSAGSAFKRPEGYFAGKLIADAGLKGYHIGGACVSKKHAGFIINTGGATEGDVRKLIDHIILTVQDRYGVTLEPEIKFI